MKRFPRPARAPIPLRAAFGFLFVVVLVGGCASTKEREELAQEYYNLGNAFFELRDYEQSYRYYRRAIALSESIPAAGYNLARLHMEREEHAQALAVLDEILDSDPENTLVRETRAYVLYQLGNSAAARSEYRDLLASSPGRRRAAYNLGLLEMDAGEYTRATEVLVEYLPFAEDDEEYRWLLSDAHFHAGENERALSQLEFYQSLVADQPASLARLAVRYVEWEYYLAALELFESLPEEELVETDPAWARARAELVGGGDFNRGLSALEDALRGGFADLPALQTLYRALPDDEQAPLDDLFRDYDIRLPENSADETGAPTPDPVN